MKVYIIGYDLNKAGQDYESLYEQIKKLGMWWHYLDSTWIVKCEMTAVEIRDRLSSYMDKNDLLFVARLSGEAAWFGFNEKGSDWLRNNL